MYIATWSRIYSRVLEEIRTWALKIENVSGFFDRILWNLRSLCCEASHFYFEQLHTFMTLSS